MDCSTRSASSRRQLRIASSLKAASMRIINLNPGHRHRRQRVVRRYRGPPAADGRRHASQTRRPRRACRSTSSSRTRTWMPSPFPIAITITSARCRWPCATFPKAHVLMTELSYFLVERVLHNSVNVMTRQRDELGIREYPLYTHDEVDDIAPLFQGFQIQPRNRMGRVSQDPRRISVAHAGILRRRPRARLGRHHGARPEGNPLLHRRRLFPRPDHSESRALRGREGRRADHGNHARQPRHRRPASRAQRKSSASAAAIQRALKRKGCVLIPDVRAGAHAGNPRAARVADARRASSNRSPSTSADWAACSRKSTTSKRTARIASIRNLQLHEALNLVVLEKGQAEIMKLSGGRLFVITAGMMSENTAAHDLALRMIGDERQVIFFVGYADPDTPGGRLKAAKPGETFLFSPSGGEVTRRCEVRGLRPHRPRQPRGPAGFRRPGRAARRAARPRRR